MIDNNFALAATPKERFIIPGTMEVWVVSVFRDHGLRLVVAAHFQAREDDLADCKLDRRLTRGIVAKTLGEPGA